MKAEQFADERIPVLFRGELFPPLQDRLAQQRRQWFQSLHQRDRVVHAKAILLLDQLHPLRERRDQRDAASATHTAEKRFRQLQLADTFALRFDKDDPRRVERTEQRHDSGLEGFLRGLRDTGKFAQQGAAVTRHAFEAERLCPCRRQRGEEPALTRAGKAAQDHEPKAQGKRLELADDVSAISPIAAVELHGAPADLVQDMGERTAALSAAPAVDQRLPLTRFIGERSVQHCRDVSCDQRATESAGLEGGADIQGADTGALLIIEHGQIHRSGKMIEGELRRATHVDAVGKSLQRIDAHAQCEGVPLAHRGFTGSLSKGLSSRQTLSSNLACAASTGWMRSAWNMALSSAKPSNRKATSAALRSRPPPAYVVSKRGPSAGP